MKVRIKVRPSGLINGRDWPQVGEVIDLPETVALGMLNAQHVTAVEEKDEAETRPANTDGAETRTDAPVKRGPGRPRKNQG